MAKASRCPSECCQQRILEADESGTEVARGEQAYARWKGGQSTAVANASQPSIKVRTATAFAADAGPGEPDLARVQIERISRADVERPSGRRFGALVHAVLAAVELDANADKISAIVHANARLMDATTAETGAAVTTVWAAIQHPLMQRAAKAHAIRREAPVQHYREDGTLIEGVVDLAFTEDTSEFNGWTVVDFKTDREIEKAQDRYRSQVAAYVDAVRLATGTAVRGFLLIV
jgi:ATP-dependent helicase/nuclease subunit A